jgi:hypothetical protein
MLCGNAGEILDEPEFGVVGRVVTAEPRHGAADASAAVPNWRPSVRRFSVIAVALCVFVFGCGQERHAAGRVTLNGQAATFISGNPCEWNGDSGCDLRFLTRRSPKLCLSQSDPVRVLAGDGVRDVRAAAVRVPLRDTGRVDLRSARDASGWTIDLRPLPATTRALEITVVYDGGVLTPYQPAGDLGEGVAPRPIDTAVYAVRVRRAPCR